MFQFPERHFLGDTLREELTIGWPRGSAARLAMAQRLGGALQAVGMSNVELDAPGRALSGGFQRRAGRRARRARAQAVAGC